MWGGRRRAEGRKGEKEKGRKGEEEKRSTGSYRDGEGIVRDFYF